jgi:hypothetical protein
LGRLLSRGGGRGARGAAAVVVGGGRRAGEWMVALDLLAERIRSLSFALFECSRQAVAQEDPPPMRLLRFR